MSSADAPAPASPAPAGTFYDLKAPKPGSSGQMIDFADFRGKVVLIFNSATKCGFTPQLKELQELHTKYASRGLVVLGFPSDEFGGQNPEDDAGTASFCERNYGVDFQFGAKTKVNGKDASEVFKWLKAQKNGRGLLGINLLKWNFTKFIVDRQGNVVDRYSPQTTPKSIEPTIEKLLAEGGNAQL